MTEELRKVRKGTKSCTECRRRKVRCIWSTDDAPSCRRCEERGTNCVAQVYSLRTPGSRKLTSKDRIARLENQITTLSRALQAEDLKPNTGKEAGEYRVTPPEVHSETDESDYGSIESEGEGFTQDPPTHLQTLFENDLISLDASRPDAHELHRQKALSQLFRAARHKLQQLIPPVEDVRVIADYAEQWLSLFHSLFPAPSMIKSGEDMVKQYEAVKSSSVHPAFLASWLLSIAMTIHQVPKEKLGDEKELKGFRNPTQFSRTVSDAVEGTIMKYDALLGTTQGIDAAMLFLRLQLSRGNFKKTWLQLRRVIAVAELIGLHRAARRADPNIPDASFEGNVWSVDAQHGANRKAQVWESLCSIDRISGMLFNLPPGTRRYRLPQHAHILSNGKLALRAYLCSISEIAMKVQDFDDLELPERPDTELYAQVLKVDGELRVLASVAPASWWYGTQHLSDQLLQYWHFYITIRAHLPFTLRHDTSDQYSFSRLACMKACQTLVQRYQILRASLPTGFFVCRVIDLQVFSALVVLVLAYHASTPGEKTNLLAQGGKAPEILVPEAMEFMRSISGEPAADFVRQAIDAVSSLTQLLEGGGPQNSSNELKLKVPLLGKLHVRKKLQRSAPTPHPQNSGLHESHYSSLRPTSSMERVMGASSAFAAGNETPNPMQGDFSWDPLSWSVEDDQAGTFQDAVMMEDFAPFGSWWTPDGAELEL